MFGSWPYRQFNVFIITFLLISIIGLPFFTQNPSFQAASTFSTDQADGIYLSEQFTDISSSHLDNTVITSGDIGLDPDGLTTYSYDFTDWTNKSDNRMYTHKPIVFSKIIPPSFHQLLAQEVTSTDIYEKVSSKDTITHPDHTNGTTSLLKQSHLFRFKINQDQEAISKLGLSWRGKSESDANTTLYYWLPSSIPNIGIWQIADVKKSNDSFIELRQNFTGDLFIDNTGYVTFAVVVTPIHGKKCALFTDYVSLSAQVSGFFPEGTVQSPSIIPSTINRWERFYFEDKTSNNTSIKYHLLYQNQTGQLTYVENNYVSGNTKGLQSSPIDISHIPASYNLTIQADLTTSYLSETPTLKSWGLSWQTEKNKWKDSFTSSLRIDTDELKHVKRENAEINLIPILNHWPQQGGETAGNTRASSGLGTQNKENNLSWYSSVKVGGNYVNPVIRDGMLYIPSNDGEKLYSFDAQATTGLTTYNPIQACLRIPSFPIECTPLIIDEQVIIATGAAQKYGGIANMVYGFSTDLSETPEWSFNYQTVNANDPAISYAASPVYHQNHIYLSTWNGDESILNSVWNFINFSRGNNKLLVLDSQGTFQWEYDLPTASFSSPAVKGNTIIVGCERINGDSIIALNKDGEELWKQNVGPIGRASPAIYENKVIVVAKNPSNLYVTANTKVYALNLYNGNIIWNKTIGDSTFDPYQYAGCNSPAVADDTVFVTSPDGMIYAFDVDNGDELWKKRIYNRGLLPTSPYLISSPAYAEGIIYVGTPEGRFYAIDSVTNETLWSNTTKEGTAVVSSPVVVDGFTYFVEAEGIVQCRGRLQIPPGEQITGTVLSQPISLPDDDNYIWNRFFADYDYQNSDISFAITDESGKTILLSEVDDGQSISTNAVKNHDTIRLKADFIAQATGKITLFEWAVDFQADGVQDNITIFYENSFNYDDMPPNCSIDVRNQDSGLWNNSASYRLDYENETGSFITDWIPATFTGENGTTLRETIWANISLLDGAENITDYNRIRFSIKDSSGDETVSAWFSFTITPADQAVPEFDLQSFTPSSGWITSPTPTCTVQVQDRGTGGNTTGLNTSDVTYTLNYTDNTGTHSDVFEATCSGNLGTIGKQTITATIADNPQSDSITNVSSIRFTISDMAGNENTSPWFNVTLDDTEPSSEISNVGSIPAVTNSSPVRIEATATDTISGIQHVTLFYRLSGSTQWTSFKNDPTSPYEFDFTIGSDDGGEYELCTVAVDNAGNEESFPTQVQVVFLYDPNPPMKPSFATNYRFTGDTVPTFSDVTFSDDYQLKQVSYRMNFEGLLEWTEINEEELDLQSYTPTWNLTEEQWNQMQEDVTYYIYFKLTDYLGNTYTTPSQSQALELVKDLSTDSTFVPDLSSFDTWQWNNEYLIKVNINQTNVSLMQLWYQYSKDNDSWSNWTQFGENITDAPYEWVFTPPNDSGYYRFKTTVVTPQGITDYINEDIIYITTFPIIELVIMSVLIIILFIISALVFMRRKRIRMNQ